MKVTDAIPEWREKDVILDLYRVEGVLGEGGMGRVYRVRHTGWDIDLAVKTPLTKHLTEAGKQSFTREAETWVNLGLYPHTVSCYYIREIDGLPRVFAECVEGGSLKDWISDGRLYEGGAHGALERILDVAIQFAWGLHFAHEQGLVHQDVKPANLLLTPDSVAKVTDFGLAQARAASGEEGEESDPTKSVVVAGAGAMTPAYCSPEQRAKQPLTKRTDIWSWGVSVFEMFTGDLYWRFGPEVEGALNPYLEEWAKGERTEEGGLPRMPEAVVKLLRRCFQRSPQERPRDMREVAEALQDIYEKETGRAYARTQPKAGKWLADSLNNRAVSLLDLGKKSEALELWAEALRVHPQHPEATYNRGLISWREAETDDAALLRHLEGVKTSNRPAWWGEYLQALVHLERNDAASAVRTLEKIATVEGAQAELSSLLEQARERLSGSTGVRFTIKEMDAVQHASYSPDGEQIFSVVSTKVKLWSAGAGRYLKTLSEGDRPIKSICFSPDGKLAAAASTDGSISVWRAQTGAYVQYIPGLKDVMKSFDADLTKLVRDGYTGHLDAVEAVGFSPDGEYLASGSSDNTIKLWDVRSGECLRTMTGYKDKLLRPRVTSVSYSPDGRLLASANSDTTVKLWDTGTGKRVRAFAAHGASVGVVRFSPDGKVLVSAGDDRMVKLWDAESGQCLRTLAAHTEPVRSVCFSSDGKYLASGSWDKTIKLWELATGRCLRTLEGHTDMVNSVSFSPDRQCVASASSDKNIRVWRVSFTQIASPFLLSQISASEKVAEVEEIYARHLADARAALKDGDLSATTKHLRDARSLPGCERRKEAVDLSASLYLRMARVSLKAVWQEDTSRLVFREEISKPTLSPDGAYIAAINSETVKLYETETGRWLRDFDGHSSGVNAVSFSPDGKLLASGGTDRTVRLWDALTGQCLHTIEAHADFVHAVSFSPDGKLVASCSGDKDNTIKVWDVATGACVQTFLILERQREYIDEIGHWISSISFSPDGRLVVTAGSDRVIRVWELATGTRLKALTGHSKAVGSVIFSPDGTQLASAGWDKTIILWNVKTGKSAGVFWGHSDGVSAVAFSPDGGYLASGSFDKTVKIWDRGTLQCLHTLEGHTAGVNKVGFSPDARYILSCSEARLNNVCSLLWFLDWELEERETVDWDEEARPHLQNFLITHTPPTGQLPAERKPTKGELKRALKREGASEWDEQDFDRLMYKLSCAGYCHLSAEGVRRELEEMMEAWASTPPEPFPSEPLSPAAVASCILMVLIAALVLVGALVLINKLLM